MELKINIENIFSSIIAGYILFLITKNHSLSAKTKSGLVIKLKFNSLEFKFEFNKNRK